MLDQFIGTFTLAFIFILIALLAIGLSWLITGKQKIKGGTCGRNPNKDKDESCGTKASCQLCEKNNNETDQKKGCDNEES